MCHYCQYDEIYGFEYPKQYISKRKRYAKPGEHIPNSNEAKMLRRLMSQTGLTEKELREHKKYRKMLSSAQKQKGDKTKYERKGIWILKYVLRELKLPKEHPLVLVKLKEKMNEYRLVNLWNYPYGLSAEQIIKMY